MPTHICNGCQKSKITALSQCTGSTEKNETLQKQGNRDTEDLVIYNPPQCKNLWTVSLKVEAGSSTSTSTTDATPSTQTRKEQSLCHLSSRPANAFPYLPAWDAHLPAQEWTLRTPGQCGSQQCSYSSQSHFQSLVSPVEGMKAHAQIRKPFSLCQCTLHFAGERSHNKVHVLTLWELSIEGRTAVGKKSKARRGWCLLLPDFLSIYVPETPRNFMSTNRVPYWKT